MIGLFLTDPGPDIFPDGVDVKSRRQLCDRDWQGKIPGTDTPLSW